MPPPRRCAASQEIENGGGPPVGYTSLSLASMQDRMDTLSPSAATADATDHAVKTSIPGTPSVKPRGSMRGGESVDERNPYQIVGSLVY